MLHRGFGLAVVAWVRTASSGLRVLDPGLTCSRPPLLDSHNDAAPDERLGTHMPTGYLLNALSVSAKEGFRL
jgi:hypothetical protein